MHQLIYATYELKSSIYKSTRQCTTDLISMIGTLLHKAFIIHVITHYIELSLSSLPNMHPKMHCKVEGKLFAAVIDRQKIDISLTLRAIFPGFTLDSGARFSEPVVPTFHETKTGFI